MQGPAGTSDCLAAGPMHGAGVQGRDVCLWQARHCLQASRRPPTFAQGDRATTVRQHLERHPAIMDELPPPDLIGRYSG